MDEVMRYGKVLLSLWEWLKLEGMSGAELKLNEDYVYPVPAQLA